MSEFSLVTGLIEWRVEIKELDELPPIRPETEMGSDGSIEYYVTEWKDPYGMINQTWRMNPYEGSISHFPDLIPYFQLLGV